MSDTRPLFAAARMASLCTPSDIAEMSRHGSRIGRTVELRTREDANPDRRAYARRICEPTAEYPDGWMSGWIPAPKGDAVHPLADLAAAEKVQLSRHDAGLRKTKKQARMHHVLLTVTPDWLTENGRSLHGFNDRQRALLQAGEEWAEGAFGQGSCIATRLDLDEAGGATIDIFLQPVREFTVGRKPKDGTQAVRRYVAPTKAMDELGAQHGHARRHSWRGLQDSWAAYAQAHLDPRLQRGRPKGATGREHLAPEPFAAMMDAARDELADLEADRDAARDFADRLPEIDRQLAEAERELERVEESRDAASDDLAEILAERDAVRADLPALRVEARDLRGERDTARTERDAALAERDRSRTEAASAQAEAARDKRAAGRIAEGLAQLREEARAEVASLKAWVGRWAEYAREVGVRLRPAPPASPPDLSAPPADDDPRDELLGHAAPPEPRPAPSRQVETEARQAEDGDNPAPGM